MLEKETKKLQEKYIVALEHVDNETAEDLTDILKGWQIQPILRGENGPEGWIYRKKWNGYYYSLQINKHKGIVSLTSSEPWSTEELPGIASVETIVVGKKRGYVRFSSKNQSYQIAKEGNYHCGPSKNGNVKIQL